MLGCYAGPWGIARVHTRRVHPKVHVDHEIELAGRRLTGEIDVLDEPVGAFLPEDVVMGAKEVLEHVLVTARARPGEVAPPGPEDLRVVRVVVDVLDCEVQIAVDEFVADILGDLLEIILWIGCAIEGFSGDVFRTRS